MTEPKIFRKNTTAGFRQFLRDHAHGETSEVRS